MMEEVKPLRNNDNGNISKIQRGKLMKRNKIQGARKEKVVAIFAVN